MKVSTLSIILFFLLSLNSKSQNLVLNNSFENFNFTSCEISDSFSEIAIDWDSPNTKEGDVYFTTIAQDCYYFQPNSTYSGPIGIKGSEAPSDGNVFAGIWVYTIDGLEQREYVRGKLSSVLEEGFTYRVKLKISLADNMESSLGELGIAFMETQQVQTMDDLVIAEPQIILSSGLDVIDGWVQIDTTFISDSNYEYFIIGNFKSDQDTEINSNPNASSAPGTYGAYYFLDDISVELEMVSSVTKNQIPNLEIFPSLVTENINYKTNVANINFCKIVNQYGQILKVEITRNNKEGSIDCSFLSPGIYYLTAEDENENLLSTCKFIKI